MQCNGLTNTTETLCCTTDARILKLFTRWASNVQYHRCVSCHLLSPFTIHDPPQASSVTYYHTVFNSHNAAWGSFSCVRQAERPTFKTGFVKGSCQPPKGGPCIIHDHLHNLPSPYQGVHHTFTTAQCTRKEPEHTVQKYIGIVQYEIDKTPQALKSSRLVCWWIWWQHRWLVVKCFFMQALHIFDHRGHRYATL